MVKSKIKIYIVLLLSLLISFLFGAGVLLHVNASEEHRFSANIESLNNLYQGDTLIVPEGKFGSISANALVYAPDGTVYNTQEIYLKICGNYKLSYVAEIAGKDYTHNEYFTVQEKSYTLSGTSTATYMYDDLTGRDGLMLNLEPNSHFMFNVPINLNEVNSKNPIIEFTTSPQKLGINDAKIIRFKFTDIYDSNNTVELKVSVGTGNVANWPWGTCNARANSQTFKANDNAAAEPVVRINGGTYFQHYANNSDGTYTNMLKDQIYGVWFDMETNSLYLTYYHFGIARLVDTFIIDFDDASYQEKLFEGFTTGEIYLDISCEEYTGSTANLLITKIGSYDLTKSAIPDEMPPVISIDTGIYDESTLPNGVVGYSYPIFTAIAKDRYGFVDVETRVFYRYTRESGVYYDRTGNFVDEIGINNERFKTKKAGYYAICYRAEDYNGNFVEKVIGIDVLNSIEDTLSVSVSQEYALEGVVGGLVKLPYIEGCDGGILPYTYIYEVSLNGQKVDLSGNEMTGYFFIPKTAGQYSVNIGVFDMLGNKETVSYDIVISQTNDASFINTPELPKYLIADAPYCLDEVYMQSKDGNKVLANVKVLDGVGLREYNFGESITFKADESGNATLCYYNGVNEANYTIPVLNVKDEKGALLIENYFIANGGVTLVKDSIGLGLRATESGTALFIRDLLAKDLSVAFSAKNFGTDFSAFSMTLIDMVNPSIAIKVGLHADENGNINVYFNNQRFTKANFSTGLEYINTLFSFDVNENLIKVGDSISVKAKKTLYGETFAGFDSGKVYISFDVEEILQPATLYIKQINLQTFRETTLSDTTRPSLFLNGDFERLYVQKGETIDLFSAVANDILSPYTSVSLTVSLNDVSVSSTNGILLEGAPCSSGKTYSFKASQEGTYLVRYVATDWRYMTAEVAFYIHVTEKEPPSLIIENMPQEAKIGWIKLPTMQATDNGAGEVTVYVVVQKPSGEFLYVQDREFYADKEGNYRIIVTAMDILGNTTRQEYELTIK